jgi:GTP-binding protein
MRNYQTTFVKSSSTYKECPPADKPEYAFIGRSNVGKSSLINRLVQQKNLAKTSQTPGKTKLINHFVVDDLWYLVDLPGYGYAKLSKEERAKFETLIDEYLLLRENLICTFVLIDIRHAPQKVDLAFMEQLALNGIPFYMVFTKADKLSTTQMNNHVELYLKQLAETWSELPTYFVTSADTGLGREEILASIDLLNKDFKK